MTSPTPAIVGVATSLTAFVGRARRGAGNRPVRIESFGDFERVFGHPDADHPLGNTVRDFFINGGTEAIVVRVVPAGGRRGGLTAADILGEEEDRTGLFALGKADLFNLLCVPADTRSGTTDAAVYRGAAAFCEKHRAMLIVDPPADWSSTVPPTALLADPAKALADLGIQGSPARNVAVYFPRLLETDPEGGGGTSAFGPCGAVAGIMARTDAATGVWRAPAGADAVIAGTQGLEVELGGDESDVLNRAGINSLRRLSGRGCVVWGARTLRGDDRLADEYKYIPVRRLALFIEESVSRGLRWAIFEPNDEPLRTQIRAVVGEFMQGLFLRGAFQGPTPREAYFVKCDGETTSPDDVDRGIVNVVIGFAPLRPAEFVIITLPQMAGRRVKGRARSPRSRVAPRRRSS